MSVSITSRSQIVEELWSEAVFQHKLWCPKLAGRVFRIYQSPLLYQDVAERAELLHMAALSCLQLSATRIRHCIWKILKWRSALDILYTLLLGRCCSVLGTGGLAMQKQQASRAWSAKFGSTVGTLWARPAWATLMCTKPPGSSFPEAHAQRDKHFATWHAATVGRSASASRHAEDTCWTSY